MVTRVGMTYNALPPWTIRSATPAGPGPARARGSTPMKHRSMNACGVSNSNILHGGDGDTPDDDDDDLDGAWTFFSEPLYSFILAYKWNFMLKLSSDFQNFLQQYLIFFW